MVWVVKFFSEKGTYGTLTAAWNEGDSDEFLYSENIDVADESATRNFTEVAKKLRGNESTAREDKYVNVIEANFNR
jgi:hypothetical protein